ncbi:MAG: hypothetical protein WBF43_05240 [Methylocella sp.]
MWTRCRQQLNLKELDHAGIEKVEQLFLDGSNDLVNIEKLWKNAIATKLR